MIQLNYLKINDIPVIELVDNQLKNEKLPLVVFFHGWTSVKESVLVNGYELAKRGIRAVLPGAYKHGERAPIGKAKENQLIFWDVVAKNILEFKDIIHYYTEKNLADERRIGAAGLSMGGITTCSAITQYDWIKAAVCLMGNPDPVGYTKWLLETNNLSDVSINDLQNHPELDFNAEIEKLKFMSLYEQPEKIAGRPFHFWHGTHDELVPFEMTNKFIEQNKDKPYGDKLTFSISQEEKHKVPYKISVEMADFFAEKL